MKYLLKNAREEKGFKTNELANILGIDQALVSKFESGSRYPTRNQIPKLAEALALSFDTLMVAWIKEKIYHEHGKDVNLFKALSEILADNDYAFPTSNEPKIDSILEEIEQLKGRLQQLK